MTTPITTPESKASKLNSPRDCTRCNGSGKTDGRMIGSVWFPEKTCVGCDGAKQFPPLDIPAICAAIKGRKGLRSARPKDGRAYYVWRMARFHGGADVTMPVCADLAIYGDPFRAELDILADAVAKKVYGSNLNAALRWGRAMGYDIPRQANESASAQSCGPVLDFGAVKPETELAELL